MATTPIRVRYPMGVATIQVDLENGSVADLQQSIFAATEVPPSLQELKSGYPPQPLTLIPSLPISSLGLKRGDQLIVSTASGSKPPQSHHTKPPLPSSRAKPLVDSPTLTSGSRAKSPSPVTRPPERGAEVDDHVRVAGEGSVLVYRVVPDDNSCLFTSVGIVLEQDASAAPRLRKLIADAIQQKPDEYSDVVLGQPRKDYIKAISKPNSWGGAIELAIFADHYQTEISSFDIETGRCDRFGEGKYDNRCILMYSGIHYDATSLAPTVSSPIDFHQTVFPVNNDAVLEAAALLAKKRREKKAFTNTSTFDLRCQICSKGLKGEKGARQHAQETGHVEFGEY